jgi:hypothetical protein
MADKQKTKTIEWRDETGPHKVILPIGCDDVTLGVAYGYPFETVDMPVINSLTVARALRDHGIWTARELKTNVKDARAAVMALGNEILTALLLAVRE